MTLSKDLPNSWLEESLTELVVPRGEKILPAEMPDATFLGMDHVEAHTTRIVGGLPASTMKSSAARFYRGDVLYGRLRPYLNKVAAPLFDGLASAEFFVFPDTEILRSAFLKHRLNASDFVRFASHLNEGDRPRVGFDQIGTFRIAVPPPNEQLRIVAKVEELFSKLDKAVESLTTAREQLRVYRQAVLKYAFEGKLTADWRAENPDRLESPETLLARIRAEHEARYASAMDDWPRAVAKWRADGEAGRKPPKPTLGKVQGSPDIPASLATKCTDDWVWLPLGDVSDVSGGLTKNPKRSLLPKKMKYLRVANVYTDRLDLDEVSQIGVTDDEFDNLKLKQGDLLVVEGNGSVDQIGRVAVWENMLADVGHQNHLIRVRLHSGMSPRFFLSFLMSPLGRDLIVRQASSTSGLHTLSITKVAGLPVPIPSIEEQNRIISAVDAPLSEIEKMEQEVITALARCSILRQSILRKAFVGQLVAQDPNDVPTSVLLERIRAEREQGGRSSQKTKKRRTEEAA